MIFGQINSIVEPEIMVNNQIIENVKTFKFLGVHIDREGTFKSHIATRKTAFFSGISEIERLGVNKIDVPISMKSLLYTSLARSKLVYGLEVINFDSKTQTKLSTLESNFIKRTCELNKFSKSTILLYALNITPIKLYALKRKLQFIIQILNNSSTKELIGKGKHESLTEIFENIGVNKDHFNLGEDRYLGIIRSLTLRKLCDIIGCEKTIRETSLVVSLEYLLGRRTPENNDTLQYLLDPRRGRRG